MKNFITGVTHFNPDQLIGQKVGKYEINEKLGMGSMGVVFKVWDTLEEEFKCLKLLPQQIIMDKLSLKDLRHELKNTSKINHQNVIKAYGLDERDGLYFIVMEYIEGKTLADRLADTEDKKLPVPEVIDIMKKVCEGLNAAHSKGIIHRDLKPQNIIVTKKGDVKILDFSISSHLTKIMVRQSGYFPISGTLPYMAPEQISKKFGRENEQTDIWGLGATIYHLLSGEVPFDTENQIKDFNEKPFDLENVPKRIKLIVKKCLEKDREKRIKTIDQLIEYLNKINEETANEIDDLEIDSESENPVFKEPNDAILNRLEVKLTQAIKEILFQIVPPLAEKIIREEVDKIKMDVSKQLTSE
jgi:serine/threonine protein kinase